MTGRQLPQSRRLHKLTDMATETERKFLVNLAAWHRTGKPEGKHYRQGYLLIADDRAIRIRLAGDKAYVTIKSSAKGISRKEYEYEIPFADGKEILQDFKLPETEKIRYRIPAGELTWEVDEFLGANTGLVIAEIELEQEDQPFEKPDWLGKEVTEDERYANSSLAISSYTKWQA